MDSLYTSKVCAARFFLQSMGLCIRAATTTRPIYIFSCLIMRVAYRQWTNLCCFCSTRFCVSLHLFIAILSNGIAKQHYLIHVYRSFDTKNAENLYCSCKKNYCPVWKFDKMQLTIYRLFHRKGKCYIWFWTQFPITRLIVSFLTITFFSTISIFTRMFFSKSWITKKSHLYSLQSLLKRKLARQIICSSTQYLLE